jgi:hypothetical protein
VIDEIKKVHEKAIADYLEKRGANITEFRRVGNCMGSSEEKKSTSNDKGLREARSESPEVMNSECEDQRSSTICSE